MLDLALIALLAWGGYRGWRRGMLMTLTSLLALALGIFVCFYFTEEAMWWLAERFPDLQGSWLPYLTLVLLFVAVFIGVVLLGRVLKKVLDYTLFGTFDDALGALLGVVRMAFVVSMLLWLTSTFGLHVGEQTAESSYILPYLLQFGPWLVQTIGEVLPFGQDLMEQLERLLSPEAAPPPEHTA